MQFRNLPSRRSFLKRSAAVAASALAAPAFAPATLLGQAGRPGVSDCIRVGFIGTGHRARLLMDQLPNGAEIVAITDCYSSRAASRSTPRQNEAHTIRLTLDHLDGLGGRLEAPSRGSDVVAPTGSA